LNGFIVWQSRPKTGADVTVVDFKDTPIVYWFTAHRENVFCIRDSITISVVKDAIYVVLIACILKIIDKVPLPFASLGKF
jgi:hypothetical protein